MDEGTATYRSVTHVLADVWNAIAVERKSQRTTFDDLPASDFAIQPRFDMACISMECPELRGLGVTFGEPLDFVDRAGGLATERVESLSTARSERSKNTYGSQSPSPDGPSSPIRPRDIRYGRQIRQVN